MHSDDPAPDSPVRRVAAGLVWVVLFAGLWLYSAGPRDLGGPWLIPWHPLVLPFRSDVAVVPGAWLHTAGMWLQVVLTLGLAWSLTPRRWGVVITTCLVLLSPAFSAMFPSTYRWVLLAAAAACRWRGWMSAAGLLIAGSIFMDSILPMGIFVKYGLSQGETPLAQGAILLVATGVAAAMLRAGPRWMPALPLVGVSAAGVLMVLSAEDFVAHREAPATDAECAQVDAEIVHPLEQYAAPGSGFLPRGIAEAEDGSLALSGQGVVVILDAQGAFVRRLDRAEGYGRIELMHWDGSDLLTASANAASVWPDAGGGDPRIVSRGDFFLEMLDVDVVEGRPLWTTVDHPVFLVGHPPDIVYTGGTVGLAPFLHQYDGRLFVGDSYAVFELDPATLERLRVRRYPLMAPKTNFAGRYVLRMEAIQQFVRVIDLEDFSEVARVDTPFTPRYAAQGPDVIAFVDYFGGVLHLYDMATWTPLRSLRVGKRPRNLLWSERQGAFLGVSGCGLYRVPLR